jgi:hypothetical protein
MTPPLTAAAAFLRVSVSDRSARARLAAQDCARVPIVLLLFVAPCPVEVKVWEYNEQQGRWKVAYALSGHAEEVHDVAWAPNLGT